jgi:hypothetical protein
MESKEMTSVYRDSVIDSLERLFTSGTATALDDTQLLERFITCGDSTAFDAILERHGPMVFRVCRRMLNDPNDVTWKAELTSRRRTSSIARSAP